MGGGGAVWCTMLCYVVLCCSVVCCALLSGIVCGCCAVACFAVLSCMSVSCASLCGVLWWGMPKALLPKGKGRDRYTGGLCVSCARCV